jgi:mannosyltransferase OCH1-like enzyme
LIPKIIHYCWLSNDPYPENIVSCIDSWKKHLADYEFKKWDTTVFDINSVKWVKESFEAKKYAFAADYIRFHALYNYGGIYLDSDVEILHSFNALLSSKSFMGFEYTSAPEAAIIGSEKGIPWIKECLDFLRDRSFNEMRNNKKQLVITVIMKAILEKYYQRELYDDGKVWHLDNLDLYPYQYFSPKNYYKNTINISDKTYTIHHFNGSWYGNNRNKTKSFIHSIMTGILGRKRYYRILYNYYMRRTKHEF